MLCFAFCLGNSSLPCLLLRMAFQTQENPFPMRWTTRGIFHTQSIRINQIVSAPHNARDRCQFVFFLAVCSWESCGPTRNSSFNIPCGFIPIVPHSFNRSQSVIKRMTIDQLPCILLRSGSWTAQMLSHVVSCGLCTARFSSLIFQMPRCNSNLLCIHYSRVNCTHFISYSNNNRPGNK